MNLLRGIFFFCIFTTLIVVFSCSDSSKLESKDLQWQWTKTWGGKDILRMYKLVEHSQLIDEKRDYREFCSVSVSNIAVDKIGNVYVTGDFNFSIEFNPEGGGLITNENSFGSEIYLSKFDNNGTWQWTKTLTGPDGNDRLYVSSLSTDSLGNIYITGNCECPLDFASEDFGSYIGKLNADGDLLWTQKWFASYSESIAINDNGDINVTGGYWDGGSLDPDRDLPISSNGDMDCYLSKFDSDGNWKWSKTWGGEQFDMSLSICNDKLGYIYVTGFYSYDAEFDPLGGEFYECRGDDDAFLSRFDTDGKLDWVRTWGGGKSTSGHSVVSDHHSNAYVTGRFRGATDFNPAGGGRHLSTPGTKPSIYLSKFTRTGKWRWTESWEGFVIDDSNSIAVDNSNNAYAIGCFNRNKDDTNAYIRHYNSRGKLICTKTWGGSFVDRATSIAIDESDNVYVAGDFTGNANFNPHGGNIQSPGCYKGAYLSQFSWTTMSSIDNDNVDDIKPPKPD